MRITEGELKNVKDIVFEQTTQVEDVKKAFEQSGRNILLYLNELPKRPRELTEVHEQLDASDDNDDIRSQLFINMNSATLTGLLVSLSLIIALLIAVKCLFDVKTNDQFGRANLWVGKES